MAQCPGKSVGAVVRSTDGKYLALYRIKAPKGLAFIAGHIDENETPQAAVIRELKEEAGIAATEVREVFHGVLPNPCSRGFDSHEWWVFEVVRWTGEPVNREPAKHAWVKFCTKSEIQEAMKAMTNACDPAWSLLFKTKGIL
jgi:8-oxo-dGTP pyrophosphatase MutT (NUDIX family)